jgi:hypothetical protein
MSFENPTLEDVIEDFHSNALMEGKRGIIYTNKLRALIDDLALSATVIGTYELIPYYDKEAEAFDYRIKID